MAAALRLSWSDDLKAESDLRRMAVSFERTKIKFSQIDLKESQVNGARLNDAIVEALVEDYMQGFRNGDTFPRIIVYKGSAGYVILSGNQRSESIRRLIKDGELPKDVEVEVYLVDTKDRLLLEIIARAANVAHGGRTSKDERVQQAVYCVRNLGLSAKDAAKHFMVATTTINHHIRAGEIRAKLQRQGIEAQGATVASLSPLAQLDMDESSQLKLGSLVAQHNVPSEEVKRVVSVLTKQPTQQARTQKIKEFEKDLTAAAHTSNGHARATAVVERSKVPTRPRRDKLLSLLPRLVNFLDSGNAGEAFTSLEELQVTSKSEQEHVTTLCKRLRYRLGVIAK